MRMGIHHVLAAHAAHSATYTQPGGLYVLATGLFVTALGLVAVTNFRGFADALGDLSPQESEPRPRWRKNPSQLMTPDRPAPPAVNMARLIGGLFAFIGLNAIVAGIVSIVHGHVTILQTPAMPVPARYLWLAFGAASIAYAWIPRIFAWRPRMGGYALSAARRNRWQRPRSSQPSAVRSLSSASPTAASRSAPRPGWFPGSSDSYSSWSSDTRTSSSLPSAVMTPPRAIRRAGSGTAIARRSPTNSCLGEREALRRHRRPARPLRRLLHFAAAPARETAGSKIGTGL
jgi:hypothetical protein